MPAGPFEAMLASAASRMSRRASSGVRRTRLPAATRIPAVAIYNIVHNEYPPASVGSRQARRCAPSASRCCLGASMSGSSSAASSCSDAATAIAVGALAATLAAICHETLGHGLGCLGAGGHVTLLTSIWFRCSKWSAIIDAGGPMGNLVAGSLALGLLGYCRASATVRLLLLLSAALNLFWFMGQLTFESLT